MQNPKQVGPMESNKQNVPLQSGNQYAPMQSGSQYTPMQLNNQLNRIQFEREICCCGASTWTKVIAWIQIISSVVMIIAFGSLVLKSENIQESDDTTTEILGGLLVASIFSLILAVILYVGSKQRRVGLILSYLICSYIAIAISGITAALQVILVGLEDKLLPFLIFQLLMNALDIFFVVVINIHMQEIKNGVFIPYR